MTSSNAILTVTNIPPVIHAATDQPDGGGGFDRDEHRLDGTGVPPFSFQWLKDGTNLTDGTTISGSIISGATNFALTISNAQTNDSGSYWLIVTTCRRIGDQFHCGPDGDCAVADFREASLPRVDGGFILSGIGGTNNGTYYVLATTNLLVPLTNWTHIATNQFDSPGGFIFTNTAQTNAPQEFYILQMP